MKTPTFKDQIVADIVVNAILKDDFPGFDDGTIEGVREATRKVILLAVIVADEIMKELDPSAVQTLPDED